MEKILHRFWCPKCCSYTSFKTVSGITSGARFFPSTVWILPDLGIFQDEDAPPSKTLLAHKKLIIPFWGGRKTHGLKHTPVVRSHLFQRKITLKPVRFSQDSTITQPRESRESPGAAAAFRTLIFCLDQNMAEAWVIWLVVIFWDGVAYWKWVPIPKSNLAKNLWFTSLSWYGRNLGMI